MMDSADNHRPHPREVKIPLGPDFQRLIAGAKTGAEWMNAATKVKSK
jgi:hypothetical protein